MNDQYIKNEIEFIDQDNLAIIYSLYIVEMKYVMSRGRYFFKCRLYCSRNRERERFRIFYRNVIRLFRKIRIVRNVVKLYFEKCILYYFKLKFMSYEYNRYYFSERYED